MVNPIHQIVLVPTRSPKHEDTIWLNPYPIRRTTSSNRKTLITFHNNTTLIVPLKLASFNTKLKTAEQLRDMTVQLANKPFTFMLHPNKRRGVKNIKKADRQSPI
jgi:competence protein ComK